MNAVEYRRAKYVRILGIEDARLPFLYDRDVAQDCERMEMGRLAQLELRIPTRAFAVARAADRRQPAVEAVLQWQAEVADAHAVGGIAVLSGPVGVGKSVAAAVWAHDFAIATRKLGRGGVWKTDHFAWVSAAAFIRMSRFDDAYAEVLGVSDLILDDLGAEYLDDKGLAASVMDELIDRRYSQAGATTIITTNLRNTQLGGRYGERVADRLRECATILPVLGQSLRRREAS